MLKNITADSVWIAIKEIGIIVIYVIPLALFAIWHYNSAIGGMHYFVLAVLAYSIIFPYIRLLHTMYVDFVYYSVILIGVVFTASEYQKNQWVNKHSEVQSKIESSRNNPIDIEPDNVLELELQELLNNAPNWVSAVVNVDSSILTSQVLIWLNGFALPYILCIGLSLKLARNRFI